MSESQQPDGNLAQVISLEAFRERVQPEPVVPGDTDIAQGSYSFVDEPTFQAIARVYRVFNGGPPEEGFSVHQQLVTEGRGWVWVTHDENGGDHFAIDRHRDDLEALTRDLDVYDKEAASTLEKTIGRFYCTTLVARALIKTRYPHQDPREDISPLRVGQTELRLSRDDPEEKRQWFDVTRWRVAAGVGLLAVTHQHKELRQQTQQYLQEVIESRYNYFEAMQTAEQLFGTQLPEEDKNSLDFLLGVCNPLGPFDVKKITDSSSS